ncbi:AMP-binding protein [Streptomyces sp. NPDC048405]|uniref:AMP-binding protein n=1 Tax=unclassified Streptomyces TaxID=2593676 RepID=UPI003722E9EB|nr:AMP-binding protein [Streptomyces sp. NBC_01124]
MGPLESTRSPGPGGGTTAATTPVTSLLTGPPLTDPGPASLADVLRRAAARRTGPAVCHLDAEGRETWTGYGELFADASRLLGGLRRAGVVRGDRVLLHLGDERELLTVFWACVLGGFVPAPVASREGPDGLSDAWHTLRGPWIVADDATGTALVDGPRAHWLGSAAHLSGPAAGADVTPTPGRGDDLAVLVLTAGSTGAPKAVMLSHRNIVSRSAGTALANGVGDACVTFNWMPLDHVSGLVMFHVRDVYAAAAQIHARKEWVLADPLRWLDVIDRHRVSVAWAADSFFDRVAARVEDGTAAGRRWDLSALAYVMNGGAPVKARTVRRFAAALAPHGLPATAMRPGWGMSETASGVVDHRLDARRLDPGARWVSSGVPHPGVSVRVVDEDDRTVPPGTLGRLQVTGPTTTRGYFGAEEETRAAFTADGWLRTGDMAFVADGALTVTGSADDLVRQGEVSCHGHEIEHLLAGFDGLLPGSAVACTAADGTLAVFCSLAPDASADRTAREVRAAVARRFGVDVAHVVPLDLADIPRTPTGKPRRARLRALIPARDTRPADTPDEEHPPCS